MWTYHPELLDRPVPRYTSYPTAAEFSDRVGTSHQAEALAAIGQDTRLSLYVHIPYCREICWYCGCNTGAANRRGRLRAYLDALHAEIDLMSRMLGGRGTVSRIAFGGGSPNAIAPLDFVRLVDRLMTSFGAPGAALSVELDPRDLDADWIEALAGIGVTRASLGVQTLAPHVQSAIGRIQPQSMIESATAQLRSAGVASLNFDLMYGLPGLSIGDLERTLEATIALGPDRIALFGYAHVPHLVPRQRQICADHLPGALDRFNQAAFGHAFLTGAGYQSVGFDHFALPADPLAEAARAGRLKRNFQGFTDDASEILIGIGASAISVFPDRLVQNEKNAGRYRMRASSGLLSGVLGALRTNEDRLRGAVITGILCHGEADIAPFDRADLSRRLAPFAARSLLSIEGTMLRLAPQALPYRRVIAAVFDGYRQPDDGRFSNAI